MAYLYTDCRKEKLYWKVDVATGETTSGFKGLPNWVGQWRAVVISQKWSHGNIELLQRYWPSPSYGYGPGARPGTASLSRENHTRNPGADFWHLPLYFGL